VFYVHIRLSVLLFIVKTAGRSSEGALLI